MTVMTPTTATSAATVSVLFDIILCALLAAPLQAGLGTVRPREALI